VISNLSEAEQKICSGDADDDDDDDDSDDTSDGFFARGAILGNAFSIAAVPFVLSWMSVS